GRRHTRFSRDWSSDVCSSDLRDRRAVGTAVDDEVMALGFAADSFVDCLGDQLVALRSTQWRSQIRGIFLAQAHVKGACAGQPDAIAALTEIVRHRSDETKTSPGFGHFDVTGWAACFVGNIPQRELPLQPRAHE